MQDTEIELPPGLGETEISIFANARATDPQSIKLGVVLAAIQDGRWADKITKLRALLTRGGDAYNAQKKYLPAITLSGSFSVRNAQSLLKHSGLLQVDLDHLDHPAKVRDQLAADPHVAAAFLSPSAQGVKAVLRIPADPARHNASFQAAERYFRKTHGLESDPACKDVSRLCFVSHDPELRTNPDAVTLNVEAWTEPEAQKSFVPPEPGKQKHELTKPPPAEKTERVKDALTHLSAEERKQWVEVGMAIKNSCLQDGFAVWHEWSSRAATYKDEADCRREWESFKPSSIFLGTIFHRARMQEPWPEPIPLIREAETPKPYPVDALGPIIGEAVREFQGYGKQPLAMVGSSALATASLACQGLADVARDSMNIGPISLSILCVAESGERKTSTDQTFSKPLRDWQRTRVDEMQDEIRQSKAKHSAWKSERDGLLNAIREAKKTSRPISGQSLDSLKTELERHELEEPEILCAPQIFFEDSTSEALAYFAATGHPTFALWSDEAGLTLGSQGMKDDRIMSFLALMNRLWDGGEFMPTRKTAETALVSGRRMTVNLMLQPAVLDHWQETRNGLSRGIGAFARFLILKPETTMGTRHYQPPPEASPKLFSAWPKIR